MCVCVWGGGNTRREVEKRTQFIKKEMRNKDPADDPMEKEKERKKRGKWKEVKDQTNQAMSSLCLPPPTYASYILKQQKRYKEAAV